LFWFNHIRANILDQRSRVDIPFFSLLSYAIARGRKTIRSESGKGREHRKEANEEVEVFTTGKDRFL